MKKTISLLLAILMIVSTMTVFSFAKVVNPFVDVKSTDWFYSNVMYVYNKKMMTGVENDQFGPYVTTSRGMIVTILYRLEGSPTPLIDCPFKDVKSGSYYENAIAWASNYKIVNGYDSETFGPDDDITREQMASILYRYSKFHKYCVSGEANLNSFPDANKVESYAKTAMQWAVAFGLINGNDGKLDPAGNAERCQVAAILNRFCEKYN